jgi:phosphoglycolate phosphatase
MRRAEAMGSAVVVFDLDGTLSNPLEGFARSMNHALRLQGLPQREPHELARFIGPPLYDSAVELTGSADPTRHNRLIADYRQRYGESGYAENTLYDGIPEVLHALRDAGATLGVCTSKRADFAESILRNFGLRGLFDFVSGGDIGVHKWQQLQALREAGAVDAASVMVGDRDVDIAAAHRNGLQACGVLWGFGSREELQAESPRHLAEAPSQLRLLARAVTG